MSQYSPLWLMGVAFFAAGCAYFFNRRLAKLAYEWEIKRHVARTAEGFCDEIMKLAISYWSCDSNNKNSTEMRILADKISANNKLLSSFISDNFPDDDIFEDVCDVIDAVSEAPEFGQTNRLADSERVARCITAIVGLRMKISGVVK